MALHDLLLPHLQRSRVRAPLHLQVQNGETIIHRATRRRSVPHDSCSPLLCDTWRREFAASCAPSGLSTPPVGACPVAVRYANTPFVNNQSPCNLLRASRMKGYDMPSTQRMHIVLEALVDMVIRAEWRCVWHPSESSSRSTEPASRWHCHNMHAQPRFAFGNVNNRSSHQSY